MLKQPAWYRKVESWLEPVQPVVYGLYVVLLVVSVWMMIQPSRTLRTAWITYMFMP